MDVSCVRRSGTFTVGQKTVFLESAREDAAWLFFVVKGLNYGQSSLGARPVDDAFLQEFSTRDNE